MNWPDDDDQFEDKKSKRIHRKPRKPFARPDENGDSYDEDEHKRKRAGKRAHRPRTSNDDFWERNQ